MIRLRDYQVRIEDECRTHYRNGKRSVLIQLATGGGKSLTGASIAKQVVARGKSVFWITHRIELIRQVSGAFRQHGVAHGFIAAGIDRKSVPVQICSIDTLRRRLPSITSPDLIVWDEARHLGAKTWKHVYENFPKARHLGLDATPQRPNGDGLGGFFQAIVHGPSPSELISSGYLCNYRLFAPKAPDISGVHSRGGDYVVGELSERMSKPQIVGDCISHYKKFANGKRALDFCVSIEHSKASAAAFRNHGFSAVHIDGETNGDLRTAMLQEFELGKIQIVCSVSLFTEGLDIPGVECVIQSRPTQSTPLYLQMIGRGLRPAPGKTECIIIDAVDNLGMHGLPDDDRDWQLTYDEEHQKKKAEMPPPRICPSCFGASPARAIRCQICGERFPVEGREVAQVDGELAEIDEAEKAKRRKVQQNPASTLAGLVQIGRERKYPSPVGWAINVYTARLAKQGLTGDALQARLIADGVEAFAAEREAERTRKQRATA